MNRSQSEKRLDKSRRSGNLDIQTESIATSVDRFKCGKLDSGYETDDFSPSSAMQSSSLLFNFDDLENNNNIDLRTSVEKFTVCAGGNSFNENIFFEDNVSDLERRSEGSGNFSGNGLTMKLTGADDVDDNGMNNDINSESTNSVSASILIPTQTNTTCEFSCSEDQEACDKAASPTVLRHVVSASNVEQRNAGVYSIQTFSDGQTANTTESQTVNRRENIQNQQLEAGLVTVRGDRCVSLPDMRGFELQRMGRELRRLSDEFYYSLLANAGRRKFFVQSA